ncbi:MAG: thiol reductant exporter subunit CydD, partial [Actinomycetota bacterium]
MQTQLFGSALLGAMTLISSIALMATSGWLISKAALMPPVLTLSVAVVGVRTFALSRGVARYAERLLSHSAT